MAEGRPRRFTAAAAAAALAQLNELDDENSGNDSSEEEVPVSAQQTESDDSTDSEVSEPESDVSVSTTQSRNQENVYEDEMALHGQFIEDDNDVDPPADVIYSDLHLDQAVMLSAS